MESTVSINVALRGNTIRDSSQKNRLLNNKIRKSAKEVKLIHCDNLEVSLPFKNRARTERSHAHVIVARTAGRISCTASTYSSTREKTYETVSIFELYEIVTTQSHEARKELSDRQEYKLEYTVHLSFDNHLSAKSLLSYIYWATVSDVMRR